MRGLVFVIVAWALCGGLAACGGGETGASSDSEKHTRASAGPQLGRPETVRAQANIFGAGRHELPPSPGGGGSGVKLPGWRLPEGSGRVVTIPSATGRVIPIVEEGVDNGPEGDGVGPSDVYSWHGISGIIHRHNGMFLVGVFLGDDPPETDAPRRLNFTKRERFESLAPQLGQTFFIGDGRGRSYEVPSEATRLFLGFADAYRYVGNPGWYGNNAGKLKVTVEMTSR